MRERGLPNWAAIAQLGRTVFQSGRVSRTIYFRASSAVRIAALLGRCRRFT
jgi:hypothetical protein